jgi:hypothetical protein
MISSEMLTNSERFTLFDFTVIPRLPEQKYIIVAGFMLLYGLRAEALRSIF